MILYIIGIVLLVLLPLLWCYNGTPSEKKEARMLQYVFGTFGVGITILCNIDKSSIINETTTLALFSICAMILAAVGSFR